MGFRAITEAWNGAVFASGAGASGSMVVFGGGHDDYYGSDVHAFDLASREWRRLTTGFVTGEPGDYGEGARYADARYPDGSPLPPHTYDYVQYDAEGNDLIVLKGQAELGPNVEAVPIPLLFNLDTLGWRFGPRHPSAILNSGGFTTWDPVRRLLWGHSGDDGGGNAFVAFRPDGKNPDGSVGKWREFHPSKLPGEANHNAMQIGGDGRHALVAVHARNALAAIDLEDPSSPLLVVPSAGDQPRLEEYGALEFSRRLSAFVYYSAKHGPAVHIVDWDGSARWRRLDSRPGLDPVADAARASRGPVNRAHTFGRFRVAHYAEADIAILVRHVDSPVYALRLPDPASSA